MPPSSRDKDCSSLPPAIRFCSSSMLDAGLGEGAERLAAVEHGEAVADRVGVADVVGDEDDAEALLARPGGCIAAPSRSARRRAPRSARRGSAPWRRNRPRARWRRIAARRPKACRRPGCGSRTSMPISLHLLAGDLVGNDRNPRSGTARALRGLAAHEEVARDRHQRDHRQVLVDGGDAAHRARRAGL